MEKAVLLFACKEKVSISHIPLLTEGYVVWLKKTNIKKFPFVIKFGRMCADVVSSIWHHLILIINFSIEFNQCHPKFNFVTLSFDHPKPEGSEWRPSDPRSISIQISASPLTVSRNIFHPNIGQNLHPMVETLNYPILGGSERYTGCDRVKFTLLFYLKCSSELHQSLQYIRRGSKNQKIKISYTLYSGYSSWYLSFAPTDKWNIWIIQWTLICLRVTYNI